MKSRVATAATAAATAATAVCVGYTVLVIENGVII